MNEMALVSIIMCLLTVAMAADPFVENNFASPQSKLFDIPYQLDIDVKMESRNKRDNEDRQWNKDDGNVEPRKVYNEENTGRNWRNEPYDDDKNINARARISGRGEIDVRGQIDVNKKVRDDDRRKDEATMKEVDRTFQKKEETVIHVDKTTKKLESDSSRKTVQQDGRPRRPTARGRPKGNRPPPRATSNSRRRTPNGGRTGGQLIHRIVVKNKVVCPQTCCPYCCHDPTFSYYC